MGLVGTPLLSRMQDPYWSSLPTCRDRWRVLGQLCQVVSAAEGGTNADLAGRQTDFNGPTVKRSWEKGGRTRTQSVPFPACLLCHTASGPSGRGSPNAGFAKYAYCSYSRTLLAGLPSASKYSRCLARSLVCVRVCVPASQPWRPQHRPGHIDDERRRLAGHHGDQQCVAARWRTKPAVRTSASAQLDNAGDRLACRRLSLVRLGRLRRR